MFQIEGNEINITRGDTGIFDLILDNYTFVEGDTVYFTLKKTVNDTTPIFQKEVTTFDENKAKFYILTTDTSQLKTGKYVYDVQCSLADGRVDTVITPSPFIVSTEVTW